MHLTVQDKRWGVNMLDKVGLRKLVNENCSLLSILIGTVLVSFSIGPYQNLDTQLEYQAALGVIKWGLPYVNSIGNMVNQPPLGFYFEALFFRIFGASIYTGTTLVTLFGIGSTVLIYKIGKELYDKPTGLFATALFALTPWELVLSRSFLIDAQCLFFSLLCLSVGILAIRKGSVKLILLSGVFFAIALLTKLFAAFILIPLLLFYLYYRPKNPRRILSQFAAFCFPALLFVFLWYQVILGKGLLYIFNNGDFSALNPAGVVTSPFFIGTFLNEFGLGFFFILAAVFSLLICFSFRKTFSKIFVFDLICLTTIVIILGVDFFLSADLNLSAPYIGAVKYDYQSLPFFSLLAASLTGKSRTLLKSAKIKMQLKKLFFFSTALTGVILLAAAIFYSIYVAHVLSTFNYLQLRVESNLNTGYSFFNSSPVGNYSFLMFLQYLGFIFVLFGLVWASRRNLGSLLRLRIRQRFTESKSTYN
jgi:4-amino-4-deoxy-L-arabinose transferase-like glycosyltransferase